MNILYFLIPIAFTMAAGFVMAFIWAVKKGQFDDSVTPAHRILFEDQNERKQP